VQGRLRELEVAVSVCASFDDVLAAERVLAGIVGPHVRLRSFRAGTAVLVARVPERDVQFVMEALRDGCGRVFSVSETRRGHIELWSLPAPLPVRGLTPG